METTVEILGEHITRDKDGHSGYNNAHAVMSAVSAPYLAHDGTFHYKEADNACSILEAVTGEAA